MGRSVSKGSEYIIKHELYAARKGWSALKVHRWFESGMIHHPETETMPPCDEFPRLTPGPNWSHWEVLPYTRKDDPFVMFDRVVDRQGDMVKWTFWTDRMTFGMYLNEISLRKPEFTIFYVTFDPEGASDAYMFWELPNLKDREDRIFEDKTARTDALFRPGECPKAIQRQIRWDRYYLKMKLVEHSSAHLAREERPQLMRIRNTWAAHHRRGGRALKKLPPTNASDLTQSG